MNTPSESNNILEDERREKTLKRIKFESEVREIWREFVEDVLKLGQEDEQDWAESLVGETAEYILKIIESQHQVWVEEAIKRLPDKKPAYYGEYQGEYEGRCNGFNHALNLAKKAIRGKL